MLERVSPGVLTIDIRCAILAAKRDSHPEPEWAEGEHVQIGRACL